MADIQKNLDAIKDLDRAGQARVQAALRAAIERETIAEAGSAASSNIFSRGWIFSRLTPTMTDLESLVSLPGVNDLDAEQFADFATRLAELKRQTDRE